MDFNRRDPREMTDEETAQWMLELIEKLTEKKGSAGGACSLSAVTNPIRRNILNVLEEKALEMSEISEKIGITGPKLGYHLNVLATAYFIQIEGNTVDLTPGGVSVVRSNKRA
jgi:DNA-binding transcriptional ArsR family regulator